jgi:predicted transcriptional regulator of viral defense system
MPEPRRLTSGPRTESVTVRIARLAAKQSGVISRRQLHALGASNAWIVRAIRAGRLHRILPAVYAAGHLGVSIRGRLIAALLYAGPGAALSHLTGLWWLALLPYDGRAGVRRQPPRRLDITTPRRSSSLPNLRLHRARRLDVITYDGLPVTSVARTLIDAAPSLPLRDLRHAVAEAEYRKLIDLRELATTLGRGRPGSAALRSALERHMPELAGARSELERRFLELCERDGIPLPDVNVKVAGFTVDALWRDRLVVAELDGRSSHDGASRIEADRRRDLVLRGEGHIVLRYTWHQVTGEPERVVADLRAALNRVQ